MHPTGKTIESDRRKKKGGKGRKRKRKKKKKERKSLKTQDLLVSHSEHELFL